MVHILTMQYCLQRVNNVFLFEANAWHGSCVRVLLEAQRIECGGRIQQRTTRCWANHGSCVLSSRFCQHSAEAPPNTRPSLTPRKPTDCFVCALNVCLCCRVAHVARMTCGVRRMTCGVGRPGTRAPAR